MGLGGAERMSEQSRGEKGGGLTQEEIRGELSRRDER